MDAIPFIIEMLQKDALKKFLENNNGSDYLDYLDLAIKALIKVEIFMKRGRFREEDEDKRQALVEGVRLTVRKVAEFMSNVIQRSLQLHPSNPQNNHLIDEWMETFDFILGVVDFCNSLRQAEEANDEFNDTDVDAVMNFQVDMKSRALFLKKAFPDLSKLRDRPKVQDFLLDLSKQLDNLPQLICNACDGQPLALVLVGGLLSLKEIAYDIWYRVKEDLSKINNDPQGSTSERNNLEDRLFNIIKYCYDDLPYFLKPCFLYLACYPDRYEIPARSLTEIWIAEGFIAAEEEKEEIANNYLEQLVQRSLVDVSRRSLLGTIKHCQVPRDIHSFANKQSEKEGFLLSNPKKEIMESLFRLSIHEDPNNQYTEFHNNHIHSFLAFNFDKNIIKNAVFLKVLELRKSAIPETALPKMTYIRYLGLRDSPISELPEGIGEMENLQTLDVRGTNLRTLPESLWNISTLRHVYALPSPEIKGPPPEAKLEKLQVLRTVMVPQSWKEECPQFNVSLTKLALTITDNRVWKSVSGLLGKLVRLHSFTIIGNSLPSEYVDTRAFPNLKSVKSIRLAGKWSCTNLFIDNVEFPPNLTKLTLTKSHLKDDPLPRLSKLRALKLLCIEKNAYIGVQMICSTDGFPLLQYLELSELASLNEVDVKAGAFPLLQRLKLSKLESLRKVEVKAAFPQLQHLKLCELASLTEMVLQPTPMQQPLIVKVVRCNNLNRSSLENHRNIQINWID